MATHGAKASYYGDEAALYADPKIRPHYPAALYERLFEFAGPGTTALDVATGTGQCAHHLAQTYEQVWAIDGSEEQVKHARPHPRITYRKGLAEDTGLPGNSIDLVTVATALHWFNVPAFYKEARRVLKPGGALAAWCYYHPAIKGHDQANEVLGAFLQKVLGPYSTDVQKHCQQGYRDLEPGSGDFAHCERTSLPFEQESSIRHLVLFIRTAGVYNRMRKEKPGQPDPLPELQKQLMSALGAADDSMPLTLQYPLFVILAKDPRPL